MECAVHEGRADHIGGSKSFSILADLGSFVLGIAATMVAACHPYNHLLRSIHPAEGTEEFCVDLDDTIHSITVGQLVGYVGDAYNQGLSAEDWESVPHINFISRNDCDDLTFQELEEIELEIVVSDDWFVECLGSSACAEPLPPGNEHSDHFDHEKFIIRIETDLMLHPTRRDHFINHETGHAFGLDDPTPVKDPPDVAHCIMASDPDGDMVFELTHPVPSIMHNPGHCNVNAQEEFRFPTKWDRIAVEIQVFDNPPQ